MEKQTGLGGHYSIAVLRVLFNLGIEKKLFKQGLRFHPCTTNFTDYLLQFLCLLYVQNIKRIKVHLTEMFDMMKQTKTGEGRM